MQNRQLQHHIYTLRRYLTMNNIVLVIALVIAASWAWSSVEAVQRNYELQRQVDDKKRQLQLTRLQAENLQFEQNYYKSGEYLTLEAKRRLGLAEPGEKLLILPPNSSTAVAGDKAETSADAAIPANQTSPPPPFQQWMDFLFSAKPQD